MEKTDKFHIGRLKSIAKTLASAEADKKALIAMAVKMERSLTKLKINIANLDGKINRYKTLHANVENDPNFKMNPGDLNP